MLFRSNSADSLYKKLEDYSEDPMANVFKAGMEFMIKNKSRASSAQERIQQALSGAIDKELEIVEKKLTFLATVGSTTPFIGLFGTVWDYEFFSIYRYFKKHKFSYRGAWYSGGIVCNCTRIISGNSCSGCL